MSPDVLAFQAEMAESLHGTVHLKVKNEADSRKAIAYDDIRYYPQMIDWAADNIASLVHDQGVAPNEIVVLAPYLPDALRFSLMTRLEERQVAARSHRPSRALREESASRALLTLAKIAHPQWGVRPSGYDVAYALTAAISDLDLVRARLLAEIIYRQGGLQSFEQIHENAQNRITFDLGQRYEKLRAWIEHYQGEAPAELDVFLSRLFGEVLAQQSLRLPSEPGCRRYCRQFDRTRHASSARRCTRSSRI